MIYLYDNLIKVNYVKCGIGNNIILLHGWGTNHKTFSYLIKNLSLKFTVYALDFPGFGLSSEPSKSWGVKEYSTMLESFINDLNINKPLIIAHSFGGRIAIEYMQNNTKPVRLVLVDSAGIRRKKFINKLKILIYKLKKHIYQKYNPKKLELLVNTKGSSDYQKASVIMKKTLSIVTNYDQRKMISKIKEPVLIIWGAFDKTTPLKDGHYLNKHLKNSKLIVFESSGHFPYLEEKERFLLIIDSYARSGDLWS